MPSHTGKDAALKTTELEPSKPHTCQRCPTFYDLEYRSNDTAPKTVTTQCSDGLASLPTLVLNVSEFEGCANAKRLFLQTTRNAHGELCNTLAQPIVQGIVTILRALELTSPL